MYVKWYLNPNGLAEATISAQTSRGNKLDATATLGAALDRIFHPTILLEKMGSGHWIGQGSALMEQGRYCITCIIHLLYYPMFEVP